MAYLIWKADDIDDPRVSACAAPSRSSTMAPDKSHALKILEKATKRAESSAGWFTSDDRKWEEAGDLYQQAANAFKIERQFREAGDTFSKEAECRENGKEINDATNAWWNAAKAYKSGFPDCECHSYLIVLTSAEPANSGYCSLLPHCHSPHSSWSF